MGNLNSTTQQQHWIFSCGMNDAILHKLTNSYCACTVVLPTVTSTTPDVALHFSPESLACIFTERNFIQFLYQQQHLYCTDVKQLDREKISAACLLHCKEGTCQRSTEPTKYFMSLYTFPPTNRLHVSSLGVKLISFFISCVHFGHLYFYDFHKLSYKHSPTENRSSIY
jgi:hypothetical protein